MSIEVTEETGTIDDIRLRQVLSGRRDFGKFPFPGCEQFTVSVRLLTEEEMDDCLLNAHNEVLHKVRASGNTLREYLDETPQAIDVERQRQILFKALFTAKSTQEDAKPFFPHVDAIRTLDTVLRMQLFEEYLDWQDACNARKRLTDEQVEELVEKVKKEPSGKVSLAQYDAHTLRTCVRSLADRFPPSPTTKSSTSKP